MGSSNRDPLAWGRYLAVAGAYAACYELTRNISFSHWMLPAGLRLACLLLVPRRYWPALAVGEALPIAEMAALHASSFGVLWAFMASFPPIVVCMPAMAWLRSRYTLVRPDGQVNMGLILAATLLCAAFTAGANALVLSTVQLADGSPAPSVTLPILLAWVLGCYLGALTLTPLILAIRERMAALPGGVVTWPALRDSPLLRDALLFVVPCLALLLLVSDGTGDDNGLLTCVRIGMAVPVILMTLRHGWHGAAVGGMLASVAQASTSFQLQDPAMIRSQAILAFIASTALIFGVRIAQRIVAARAAAHPGMAVAPAPAPSPRH
ncbi:MASE1 domain-containing protein [Luteibacter aegosomaticola]|uniref:MASE1 domain-containing protein n=1 Tax=Luteibacter aegosomaticola TaxID=2911538 RepID=UPI001FFADF54|nr:MASE1 domain-containing protein [Luteibacter aegosomaticola]UPG90735.1 MASE1 domain-containing protein [Luteibacter aegosomaticola]